MTLPATLDPTPATRRRPLRSSVRTAAAAMVARYSAAVAVPLHPASVALDSGAQALVDGVSTDGTLFVEAHAVTSPVRDIDLALIVQDVFKLALIRGSRPGARAVVLVGDAAARDSITARIARTPVGDLVEIVDVPHRP